MKNRKLHLAQSKKIKTLDCSKGDRFFSISSNNLTECRSMVVNKSSHKIESHKNPTNKRYQKRLNNLAKWIYEGVNK